MTPLEVERLIEKLTEKLHALEARIDDWETKLFAESRHKIKFNDNGWTIEHPIIERLSGTLFTCPIKWERGDPSVRGTFWLDYDGTLEEIIPESEEQ